MRSAQGACVLGASALLSACGLLGDVRPTPSASMTAVTSPAPTRRSATSATPQFQTFSTAAEAQPVVRFRLLVPTFVPDNFSLAEILVATGPDGTQVVSELYRGDGAGSRSPELTVSLANSPGPLTVPSGAHDVRELRVRSKAAYSWSFPSASYGYSEIVWQEDGVTMKVRLGGDWGAAPGDPHATDPLALRIAESLRPLPR